MSSILIVPGLNGSGPAHWQSWLESRLPGSTRVEQSDWDDPYLPRWAGAVRREIDQANGATWIIAHSFGCLATVHAAWDFPEKIAGVMLVAPADPEKFGVSEILPATPPGFPSVVVASTNDPWMRFTHAAFLANQWGSRFISLGAAGHINTEAGFGAWYEGLKIFEDLRNAHSGLPVGPLGESEFRLLTQRK